MNNIGKLRETFNCDADLFNNSREKIKKIKNKEYCLLQQNKDPNFYRNQRMRAIALSIAVIASAILVSYLSWGAGIPTLICLIGIPTGCNLVACFSDIFASYEKDQEKLDQEFIQLIEPLEERRKLYEAATAERYSEEAFTALRTLDPTIQRNPPNKKEIWKAKQAYLLDLKKGLNEVWIGRGYTKAKQLFHKKRFERQIG